MRKEGLEDLAPTGYTAKRNRRKQYINEFELIVGKTRTKNGKG